MEKPKIQPQKPNTLVKYGKVIILNENDKTSHKTTSESKGTIKDILGDRNAGQILNVILPPLYFKNENGELCCQHVVTSPATQSDITELQKRLDEELIRNQVRETGLCPLRERLYKECFDELIRQITVNSSHRGIMLVRVRDEMKTVTETYQKLYMSALAYGIRIALEGFDKDAQLKNEIQKYEDEVRTLEFDIKNVEDELANIKERETVEIEAINARFEGSRLDIYEEYVGLKGNLIQVLSLPPE